MPIRRFMREWLFIRDSIGLGHLSWHNYLLSWTLKSPTLCAQIKISVVSFLMTVTAFEPSSAGYYVNLVSNINRMTGKQPLTQELANRHMTDSKKNRLGHGEPI